jgi:hypothetical protein
VADEYLLRRQRAKTNLLDFTLFTKPDYRPNWHHVKLAEKLDRVAAGLCPRLMVFLPPQHGKSELASRTRTRVPGQPPGQALRCQPTRRLTPPARLATPMAL